MKTQNNQVNIVSRVYFIAIVPTITQGTITSFESSASECYMPASNMPVDVQSNLKLSNL